MFKPIDRAASVLATATFFGAIALAPSLALAQSRADRAPIQLVATDASHADRSAAERVEERITDLHNKLHITAAQEDQWSKVAQVMRENAATIRSRIEERAAALKKMNAVDDLKSYRQLADAHAEGLNRLVPVFEELYASMTPEQQKQADRLFSERQRQGHQGAGGKM